MTDVPDQLAAAPWRSAQVKRSLYCLGVCAAIACATQSVDRAAVLLAVISSTRATSDSAYIMLDSTALRRTGVLRSAEIGSLGRMLGPRATIAAPAGMDACPDSGARRCVVMTVVSFVLEPQSALLRARWTPVAPKARCRSSYEANYRVELKSGRPGGVRVESEDFGDCGIP